MAREMMPPRFNVKVHLHLCLTPTIYKPEQRHTLTYMYNTWHIHQNIIGEFQPVSGQKLQDT